MRLTLPIHPIWSIALFAAATATPARGDWTSDLVLDTNILGGHVQGIRNHYGSQLPPAMQGHLDQLMALLVSVKAAAVQGGQDDARQYFSKHHLDGWLHAVDSELKTFQIADTADPFLNGTPNADGYTRLTAYEYMTGLLESCLASDAGNDSHEPE